MRLRDERGQLLFPALFVIPALFLFVFLLYETTKLSREKVRRQFAVDSAASLEMSLYSDFLNRSAYNNGAFPQRVFEQTLGEICIETKSDSAAIYSDVCGAKSARLYDIVYKNGAFPSDRTKGPEEYAMMDREGSWMLRFDNLPAENKNAADPNFGRRMELIRKEDANNFWITWDDAKDVYHLYVQLYQLLGIVEDSQFSVFCDMTGAGGCKNDDARHVLFRRTYWLNSGDDIAAAASGARAFEIHGFNPEPKCIEEMMIYGNKATSRAFTAYRVYEPPEPVRMKDTMQDCSGLFQMEVIHEGELRAMSVPHGGSGWPGFEVIQHWDENASALSENFFEVDFREHVVCSDGGGPCVHATVSLSHPAGPGKGLWPDPTPKFQTRLYP